MSRGWQNNWWSRCASRLRGLRKLRCSCLRVCAFANPADCRRWLQQHDFKASDCHFTLRLAHLLPPPRIIMPGDVMEAGRWTSRAVPFQPETSKTCPAGTSHAPKWLPVPRSRPNAPGIRVQPSALCSARDLPLRSHAARLSPSGARGAGRRPVPFVPHSAARLNCHLKVSTARAPANPTHLIPHPFPYNPLNFRSTIVRDFVATR